MNLLTLEQFRRIIGYHPFHFFGLGNDGVLRPTSACNSYVMQHAWQSENSAGRSDIQKAIETAENRLFEYLGYWPMPKYTTDKRVAWPKYHDNNLWRGWNIAADGRRIPVELGEHKVIEIGTEKLTLVGSAGVVLSDQDGDGINDTFTCTIATTVTDPKELAVYFQTVDRFDDTSVGDRWRIRPLFISISGGTATIRGRIWQIVKPILYEGIPDSPYAPINPATSSNFAANLDVYRRTTETEGNTITTSQATLLWEAIPCEGWWCCDSTSSLTYTGNRYDPASVGKSVARVGLRDPDLGLVTPGDSLYNATTGEWHEVVYGTWREPDAVIIRYLAGDALAADGEMQPRWQEIVARLACAELGSPICACDRSNAEIYRWSFDLARDGGANDESYQLSSNDLSNPFGTRRGQVYAWKQVRNLRLGSGTHL